MSRIVALDFETGGLDPKRHAPVQLGLAVMEGPEVLVGGEWLIGPKYKRNGRCEREYDVNALAVSGIPWSAIEEAPRPSALWRELSSWLAGHEAVTGGRPCRLPIVSHNASFDQSFWGELRYMAGEFDEAADAFVMPHELLCGPWWCTRRVVDANLSLPDSKLDTVAAHFGLSREGGKHGALEDCVLAGRVYHRLMEELYGAFEN